MDSCTWPWRRVPGWRPTPGPLARASWCWPDCIRFTPLKYACLDKCRSPLSFITEHWRGSHGRIQAFRLRVRHGFFCIGCCWSLMLLMFAVGVGNLGWMLVLGALMAMKRTCHGAATSALHWALCCSAGDSPSACKRCSRRHEPLHPACRDLSPGVTGLGAEAAEDLTRSKASPRQ